MTTAAYSAADAAVRAAVLSGRPGRCRAGQSGSCLPSADGQQCACGDHAVTSGWLMLRAGRLGHPRAQAGNYPPLRELAEFIRKEDSPTSWPIRVWIMRSPSVDQRRPERRRAHLFLGATVGNAFTAACRVLVARAGETVRVAPKGAKCCGNCLRSADAEGAIFDTAEAI